MIEQDIRLTVGVVRDILDQIGLTTGHSYGLTVIYGGRESLLSVLHPDTDASRVQVKLVFEVLPLLDYLRRESRGV